MLSLVSCSKKEVNSEKIQQIVERYTTNELLNGSIIIANKDSIIYKRSGGFANIDTKAQITSSTHFPVASLTKQFTATAILLLQEKGKLSIDDKISNYVDVPSFAQPVTIKNLLNHTSGIPDYWQNNIKNNKDSIHEFLFNADSLLFSPNTDYSYSNTGYFLLGQIIESVSNETYGEFLKENIFIPLGMDNTFVYDEKEYDGATGYDENWDVNEYFATTADGGIISAIDDLLLWDIALSQNKLLPCDIKNKMFQPAVLENGAITKYGFGWEIGLNSISLFDHLTGKYDGIVTHSGGLTSFAAYNQFDTRNDTYIILLSNQLRPELMDLIGEINGELY